MGVYLVLMLWHALESLIKNVHRLSLIVDLQLSLNRANVSIGIVMSTKQDKLQLIITNSNNITFYIRIEYYTLFIFCFFSVLQRFYSSRVKKTKISCFNDATI